MNKRKSKLLSRSALTLGLLLGCQSSNGDPSPSSEDPLTRSVCPTCNPQLGGETGDFGGEIAAACSSSWQSITVDRAQALAFGYDVAEAERRVGAPIDLPMRWRRISILDSSPTPASGYNVDTRMKMSVVIGQTYVHHVPSDPGCDGSSCPNEQGGRTSCIDSLTFPVTISFATDDGAVRGTALGEGSLPSGSHESWSAVEPAGAVRVFAKTSLHDVTGGLQLFPPGDSCDGRFLIGVDYWGDHIQGSVDPTVYCPLPGHDAGPASPWNSDHSSELLYEPISGNFPPLVPAVDNSDDTGPLPLMDASVPSNDYDDAGPIW